MTEREKWEAGLWYDANFDAELRIEREKAEELYTEFNQTRPSQKEKRAELLHKLLPGMAQERNSGMELCKPITLGDNVWLGGDVTILPGVTIGSNTVIGAGSVVVKDIPSGVVAVGNPCKVVRPITEEDSIYFHKD